MSKKNRKIGVVIPIVNNFSTLPNLLKSLDSKDLSYVYICPNWVDNKGVSKGWNAGILNCEDALCTHVLVLNDDVLMSPGSVDILANRLDRNDGCILATGRNNKSLPGCSPENFHEFRGDNEAESPDYSCFMIRPEEYLNKVGFFDENFSPAYFEDNDSHYRINLSGHVAMNVGMAPIYHYSSMSRLKPITNVTHDGFVKNREYYVSKWGGTPGQETFKTPYNDPENPVSYWYGVNNG